MRDRLPISLVSDPYFKNLFFFGIEISFIYSTALCAIAMFLIGLCMVSGPGFYIFQIFDDFSVTLPLLLIAFFQVVAVSWVYGNDK